MTKTSSELANFIIDLEDEECPDFSLHLASYQGDSSQLQDLLKDPERKKNIDSQIRPFSATPLRLAATAGCKETLKMLIENGAKIDKVDIKAQTPLFVAMVNQHWECGEMLLEAGADPNGNEKNLCTPLAVMAQRGYYDGLRFLCRYGADTEDVYRLMTGLPGFPITITATYHHLKCFACLLVHGAKPDLADLSHLDLPSYVTTQCSVPHAIIKYRCPPEFVYLYREFGGSLWIRDSRGRLATEISDRAPALALMKQLQGCPLSLRSICRLAVRRTLLGRERLGVIQTLSKHLSKELIEFLTFRHFLPTHNEAFLSTSDMELMLASITYMMDHVSPRKLPTFIGQHATKFEGFNANGDLNARLQNAKRELSNFGKRVTLPVEVK